MNPTNGEPPDGVEVQEVDVAEAARLADAGLALLLDVREDDEWATGHAPAAVHVPLGDLPYADVSSDRRVLTICRSGNRSATAAAALLALGIDARNVRGGMRAWQTAGLPITPEDAPSAAP
jgi:rhodanese-related sulfurtransferase